MLHPIKNALEPGDYLLHCRVRVEQLDQGHAMIGIEQWQKGK